MHVTCSRQRQPRDSGEALSTGCEVVADIGLVMGLELNTMGRKTRSDTIMSFLEANLARVQVPQLRASGVAAALDEWLRI